MSILEQYEHIAYTGTSLEKATAINNLLSEVYHKDVLLSRIKNCLTNGIIRTHPQAKELAELISKELLKDVNQSASAIT